MELAAWMAREGLTNAALAERLGVAENTINRWRNNWRRPRQKLMAAIFTLSGGSVAPNDFFTGVLRAPAVNQRPDRARGQGIGQ